MDKGDFRFWVVALGAFGVVFTSIIGTVFVVCRHTERMAELGYEEEPVPGSNYLMWRRRTPPPPKVEPGYDLAPTQPVVPEGILKYITTNAPPSLYELVSVTPEQLNAWTNVPQTVVCPCCEQKLIWSEPLRNYIGVVADHEYGAKKRKERQNGER